MEKIYIGTKPRGPSEIKKETKKTKKNNNPETAYWNSMKNCW